jgi:hypothetical protein
MDSRRRQKYLTRGGQALLAIVLAILLVRALTVLSRYPVREAAGLRREIAAAQDLPLDKRAPLQTALLQYEADNRIKIWTAVVQAVGGAVLLTGLLFTARNLRATQDKLDIDRQGQLTTRFIQATSQLGAERKDGRPNIEVRLGGIYALNRIAADWPKDYWPIADVLTAYVRHNAAWSAPARPASQPATDIQAVLTVLGTSSPPGGFNAWDKLDLRNTDLRGAEFWDARLAWTDFWGAHLEGAQFWGAVLSNAKLDHADLTGANLRGAKLDGASLRGTTLAGAIFDQATVWPSGFDPGLSGAVMTDSTGSTRPAPGTQG